jgi:hypothetical protein
MDAAMNLLGGGLCVRVLMQGKKVPDEAATLSQMGISRIAKPESLSFMLEPSPVLMSPSGTSEDPLLVLSRVANHPSPRYAFHCHSEPLFTTLSDTLQSNSKSKCFFMALSWHPRRLCSMCGGKKVIWNEWDSFPYTPRV